MIFLTSCTDDRGSNFVVEIVTFSTFPEKQRSGDIYKVVVFDSRTDSTLNVSKDIKSDVYAIFCDMEDHDLFFDRPIYYRIIDHPEVSKLIDMLLPNGEQLTYQVGPCHSGTRFKSVVITGFGHLPRTKIKVDTELFFDLYCLIDEQSDKVIFVDSVLYPSAQTKSGQFSKGFFSSDGRSFFYSRHDVVMRFDIEKGSLDTISGGNIPIIPWNMEGLAIYSEKAHLFKLFSEDGSVKSTIDLKILPRRLESAFAIDSTTFIVTSSAPPKLFERPSMEVFVLDFALRKPQKLIKRISALKILNAKRVN